MSVSVPNSVAKLKLMTTIIENHDPDSGLAKMCQHAVGLYEAAASTGDETLARMVTSFLNILEVGIYEGARTGPVRLHS